MTSYHYYYSQYRLNNRGLGIFAWGVGEGGMKRKQEDKRTTSPQHMHTQVSTRIKTNTFYKNSPSFLITLSGVALKESAWSFDKT